MKRGYICSNRIIRKCSSKIFIKIIFFFFESKLLTQKNLIKHKYNTQHIKTMNLLYKGLFCNKYEFYTIITQNYRLTFYYIIYFFNFSLYKYIFSEYTIDK